MLQELTLVVKNDSGHLTVFLLDTGQLVCSRITDKQSNKSCVKNIVLFGHVPAKETNMYQELGIDQSHCVSSGCRL